MSKETLPNIKKPCRECPFRKDSLEGWLGESRVREIIRQPSFVCHKKTDHQCAGHMLLVEHNAFVQVANRLGYELTLTGRELVFDSTEDCIAHHAR